jgi:hypothetical protein
MRREKDMKWLRALLLVGALPAHAAIDVITDLKLQPQERSQWCWAAVSAIAISAFPEEGRFRHLSQLEVVARRRANAPDLAAEAGRKILIEEKRVFCNKKLSNCDSPREPLLFDMDADSPPSGKALSMKAFVDDIGHDNPVVIRWGFANSSAAHALIVYGYNTNANMLKVYDPLPLDTESSEHEFWIPYETYLNPSDFHGKLVVPNHKAEQYRIRRKNGARPAGNYELVSAPPVAGRTRPPGGIETPEKLRGVIDQYIKKESARRAFLRANGEPRTGQIVAGTPIAVISLGPEQLNAPPESLLVRHAHAYVVPVWEGKEFAGSFQLLPAHGGWQQGGYSSPKIASILARLSEDPKNRGELKQGEIFYLVSIPELATFYLAHGFGKEAQLKSLDYGGREAFVPAEKAFESLNRQVRLIEADRDDKAQPATTH